jgi:hypothetical protein
MAIVRANPNTNPRATSRKALILLVDIAPPFDVFLLTD